mmetsp:Transcript_12149/g.18155  ORF Transcript_12149/g.18155 Transcript_12149/m.18155 type:complete len:262 (+) Transcript_12149:159-944(+)
MDIRRCSTSLNSQFMDELNLRKKFEKSVAKGSNDDNYGWYIDSDEDEIFDSNTNNYNLRNNLCSAFQHIMHWQESGVDTKTAPARSSSCVFNEAKNFLVNYNLSDFLDVEMDFERENEASNLRRIDSTKVPLPYNISTKSFLEKSHDGCAKQRQYTIGISNVCVIENRYAEYQVVLSNDTGLWTAWRRYSHFEILDEHAMLFLGGQSKHNKVWKKLQSKKKFRRCLDLPYLVKKGNYLSDYLRELLFALPTPHLLLLFMGS